MSPINGLIAFSLLFAFGFLSGLISFLTDYESGKCEMTYMFEYPQFVRISHDLDLKYLRFGLYAYSEGRFTEKVRNMKFDGIPVLFIPGSGGSHKQCRSFASIALRKAVNKRTRFHFDFFTVDLNNELSGLNGALLQDQLLYVNSSISQIFDLYKNQRDPPKSIILIGHSMGGVLAKALIADLPPNSELVSIVITLSSPLTRPVIALDYFFAKFYSKMNTNFATPDATTFISVAGGFNDFMVPPYLTEGGDLHAIATHVPKSWVSTDHLSIVWCKQLVLAINRALFESVDPQTKQITTNPDKRLAIFDHHLVRHSGTKFNEREIYEKDIKLLTHNGDWQESTHRQFSVRLPMGTRDMRWYSIPLIMKQEYEHLTLVAINMKAIDWVYVCPAVSIRNNQKYCESGRHLTHLSEISPSIRCKRRTLRINLHDLQLNYTTATHVAFRAMPTTESCSFHVDISDPAQRNLVFDYGPSLFSYSREILAQTAEKAVHYKIILPQLKQLTQSYTLHLEGDCADQKHHATASLVVPGINHDLHQFYTEALKAPMVFKLYKARPASETEYPSILLTLDPICRYKISMSSQYDFGMMARFYSPMLLANLAAAILLTLRNQLVHINNEERCSFVFTALKEGVKPYFVITSVKILSRLLATPLPIIGASDNQILIDENIDFILLPLILYLISVGILWLICLGFTISLIFFESTFHKLGLKFFRKTFAGRSGWTDPIVKTFDKVPGVIACVLITMSYTTSGGLAICLATIFYFLKLTQLAQEVIEDMVKNFAKSIVFKLKDKIWYKIKERWLKRHGQKSNDNLPSITSPEQVPLLDAPSEAEIDPQPGPSGIDKAEGDDSFNKEEEGSNVEDDDFERPMQIHVKDTSNQIKKVDGDKLVELLSSQMSSSPAGTAEADNPSFFEGINMSYEWFKEALENNEIFFHFTIFLIYFFVAALNVPSVLTWARNYKFTKSLVPDPVFLPAILLSFCVGPLWQLEFPRVDRMYFGGVATFVYTAAIVILIYGLVSIYRISFVLSLVVVVVTIHQLAAPKKPVQDEEEEITDPIATTNTTTEDDEISFPSETDSYSERVKAKWE